jgi:hypothetical protein
MFLKTEPNVEAVHDLGIDSPSEACLAFFEKHYSLKPIRVGIDGSFCVFSDKALSTSPYQSFHEYVAVCVGWNCLLLKESTSQTYKRKTSYF